MTDFLGSFSGISVDDISAAKRFYTQTLGLKLKNEEMGLIFLLPGGGEVFVYAKPNHEPATFTVLNLVVGDIERAIDELVANGVTFERYSDMPAPQDERGILRGKTAGMGPDIAWFKDPAGNILAIIED